MANLREKKHAYIDLVARHYDLGASASAEDAKKRRFRKPANAANEAGITVLSAAGSAFIRGYLDNFPSDASGAE